MYRRYAIYYAPKSVDFAEKAARWLGWDPMVGEHVHFPDFADQQWGEDVRSAQKYGFHGTLKAPFKLAEGCTEIQLKQALTAFANQHKCIELGALQVHAIGSFLALLPSGALHVLNDFAFSVVKEFDAMRAPLSSDDFARRRPDRLSARQRELLECWGYPLVDKEFQFHLTLSGRLSAERLDAMVTRAQEWFSEELVQPFLIEDLCLFGEADDGQFHIVSRHPLRG